jgi:hypothetical protein
MIDLSLFIPDTQFSLFVQLKFLSYDYGYLLNMPFSISLTEIHFSIDGLYFPECCSFEIVL